MSLAAPRVRGYARAAGPGIGRTLPAAGSPRVPQDCSAGAHIVQRLAPPLPVRCGGFSVYSVRDFRMWYQAYRSLFPGDLGGSGLCGHESCPSCGRHIIKDNRFVDCVDCATIPTVQPCAGAEQRAKPIRPTRKDWQDERNRCSQLPDRILSHLSSSSRAKISESWAASTGSRHKAERSAVLSQKEAAGSPRTSSMLGRSPAIGPMLIQDSSRRSARNCIHACAPLVGYMSVGILRPVRDSHPRSEQMTMTAAETAHGRRDSSGSILELVWQHHTFPRPSVEHRRDGAAERGVLSPKLHLQTSPAAIKEDRAFEPRPLVIPRFWQLVPGNEQ